MNVHIVVLWYVCVCESMCVCVFVYMCRVVFQLNVVNCGVPPSIISGHVVFLFTPRVRQITVSIFLFTLHHGNEVIIRLVWVDDLICHAHTVVRGAHTHTHLPQTGGVTSQANVNLLIITSLDLQINTCTV